MACIPMSRRCMIFKKFHPWRNARACIKCSLWIVKEDDHEQHLTCKPNSCFFSLAINVCHFLWLDKFLWLAKVSSYGRDKEKKKKCHYVRQRDRKELDYMKSRKMGKKEKKKFSTVRSSSTIKKYLISVISSITLFF